MTRKEQLDAFVMRGNFHYATYSPGDGVTRYRFSTLGGDYFAIRNEYTALGIKEALAYAFGRVHGYIQAEDEHAKRHDV